MTPAITAAADKVRASLTHHDGERWLSYFPQGPVLELLGAIEKASAPAFDAGRLAERLLAAISVHGFDFDESADEALRACRDQVAHMLDREVRPHRHRDVAALAKLVAETLALHDGDPGTDSGFDDFIAALHRSRGEAVAKAIVESIPPAPLAPSGKPWPRHPETWCDVVWIADHRAINCSTLRQARAANVAASQSRAA